MADLRVLRLPIDFGDGWSRPTLVGCGRVDCGKSRGELGGTESRCQRLTPPGSLPMAWSPTVRMFSIAATIARASDQIISFLVTTLTISETVYAKGVIPMLGFLMPRQKRFANAIQRVGGLTLNSVVNTGSYFK